MTESEMISKLLEILPGMTLGEDNEGQLIVYTDMRIDADGNIEPLEN